MTVEDPDGGVSDDVLTEIGDTISDFATWTGREGVCVPGIEALDEVPDDEPGSDTVGWYQGDRSPILVQADSSSVHETVVHELCHAVDYHEDLRPSWPAGAFPPDSVEESLSYPTETVRAHEAFARACAKGPRDLAVAAALDDACGMVTGIDAGDAWLQEVVYSDFPTTQFDPTPFTVSIDARPIEVDPLYVLSADGQRLYGGHITGATGFDGEVLLLADVYDPDVDNMQPEVLRFDPLSGDFIAGIKLPTHSAYANGVVLATSDDAPVVLITNEGADGLASEAFRIDPRAGTSTNLGLAGLPEYYATAAAVMDGRLYVADGLTGGLRAWDLDTGVATDIPNDAEISSLQPTTDGLQVGRSDGVYLLTAAGEWTELAGEQDFVSGFVTIPDVGELWLSDTEDHTPVLLDPIAGEWRLPNNPCDTPTITFGGSVGAPGDLHPLMMFMVDGEPMVLGSSADDGHPVLYALHVGAT